MRTFIAHPPGPGRLPWRVVLLTAAALLTTGCSAVAGSTLSTQRDGSQAAGDLQQHQGYRGRWLRTSQVEVFVAVEPVVRVLALRRPGEASPLAHDGERGEVGVRLAFMEPVQIPDSFGPGNRPGRFTAVSDTSATVLAEVDEPSGLQLELTAALVPRRAQVALTYHLHNRSDRPRRIAVWSVTALARSGFVIAPFGESPRSLRRLVYSWWTALPQPGMSFGRDALRVDFEAPLRGQAFKVGVTTEAGWAAAMREDGRALISHAPYQQGATYPEGGANITIFQFDGTQRQWGEIEQVGPLTDLMPHAAATLSETLTLLRIPPAAVPPSPPPGTSGVPGADAADTSTTPGAGAGPDAWRGAIEQAMQRGVTGGATPD